MSMNFFSEFTVLALFFCFQQNAYSKMKFNETGDGSNRRKRIVGGKILPSHELYDTQYFIEMMDTWSCVAEQSHDVTSECQFKNHKCGGALVHPSFILTACHCLTYTLYYKFDYERPLPAVPDLEIDDVPRYEPDFFAAIDFPGFGRITKPLHPVYNSMTLWAGNATVSKSTQKRHAASFYPHHNCVHYQIEKYPEKWEGRKHFEFDVGLVKTCEPFTIDEKVRLAPILPTGSLREQLDDFMLKMTVCLYAGWGHQPKGGGYLYEKSETVQVDTLYHHWRYIDCPKTCHHFDFHCVLCSFHHGAKIAHNSVGDSGSPITCGGYVVGLISRGAVHYHLNLTAMSDFPIACVSEYLKPSHFEWLLQFDNEVFHWLNGQPNKL